MQHQVNHLLQSLRQSTQPLHKQLDSLDALLPLKGKNLSKATLTQALLRLYPPHAVLEQTLIAAIEKLNIDYQYTPRHPLLKHDLDCLNINNEVNQPSTLLAHDSLATFIGYLYLLEGSKLGSEHISRMLNKNNIADQPITFFASCSKESGDWQQFIDFIDNTALSETAIDQTVKAANDAFEYYINAIEGYDR